MAGDESGSIEADWGRWLTPRQACDALQEVWPDDFYRGSTARDLIESQLRADLLRAAARTAIYRYQGSERERPAFTPVPKKLWPSDGLDSDFWKTGLLVRRTSPRDEYEFHNVRLDPDQIDALIVEQGGSVPEKGPKSAAPTERTQSLSRSDAEAFCRAIVAGWPSASSDWAHGKALLFFPENKIPRDWFRPIFRAIQGPKNPGKPKGTAQFGD